MEWSLVSAENQARPSKNLFQGRGQLPYSIDESISGPRQGAIAPVGYPQLTPEFLAFYRNQFHTAGKHLVAGKAGTDDRNSKPGCYKTFDHTDTRQFHTDLQLVGIWTKEFVHYPPTESGLRQEHGLLRNFADRDNVQLRQRILRVDHQHQLIAKNRMRLQTRTLYRHGDDADINRAILQLLNNFVAEVAIDVDLHAGIKAAVLGKDVGQHVKAMVPRGIDPWSATASNDSSRMCNMRSA
jgi:hypothetical protein